MKDLGPDRARVNLVDFTEIGFFNTRIPRTWVNLRA